MSLWCFHMECAALAATAAPAISAPLRSLDLLRERLPDRLRELLLDRLLLRPRDLDLLRRCLAIPAAATVPKAALAAVERLRRRLPRLVLFFVVVVVLRIIDRERERE